MALLNEINVKGVSHPIVTDDGYYQEMTVGDAEQLVATTFTEDDAPYNFRTAGGAIDIGDRKQVEGLVGGTIAWNQLVQNGNFVDSTGWQANSVFGTGVFANNKCTYTITSKNASQSVYSPTAYTEKVIKDHKYLVSAKVKCSEATTSLRMEIDPAFGKYFSLNADTETNIAAIVNAAVSRKTGFYMYPKLSSGLEVGAVFEVSNVMRFDLTQMFGSAIADYIYSLEQANAGAGVAWFKKLFPKPYYAYNAGQLMSVKALRHITRGFNAWDEDWAIDLTINGIGGNIGSKNHIPVVRGASYYVYSGAYKPSANGVRFEYFDANKNSIGGAVRYSGPYTFPDDCCYIKFGIQQSIYGTTYKNDICINLSWDGERDGEYEEYVEHVYELDPDLELRGIPKLSAGNDLYYDGDVYEPDGTVTRKYGVVDLGTLTWNLQGTGETYKEFRASLSGSKGVANNVVASVICPLFVTASRNAQGNYPLNTLGITSSGAVNIIAPLASYADATAFKTAMNGVYLVYELATPTTETADSYNSTQIVDDFGTEEFVDAGVAAGTRDVAIPVGHNSLYQPNLRAKLEMVPESPEDEGYYVVYHHDGINEYVPLIIPQELPNLPTEDGTYTLKCTVASGSATLSFESEV